MTYCTDLLKVFSIIADATTHPDETRLVIVTTGIAITIWTVANLCTFVSYYLFAAEGFCANDPGWAVD